MSHMCLGSSESGTWRAYPLMSGEKTRGEIDPKKNMNQLKRLVTDDQKAEKMDDPGFLSNDSHEAAD